MPTSRSSKGRIGLADDMRGSELPRLPIRLMLRAATESQRYPKSSDRRGRSRGCEERALQPSEVREAMLIGVRRGFGRRMLGLLARLPSVYLESQIVRVDAGPLVHASEISRPNGGSTKDDASRQALDVGGAPHRGSRKSSSCPSRRLVRPATARLGRSYRDALELHAFGERRLGSANGGERIADSTSCTRGASLFASSS